VLDVGCRKLNALFLCYCRAMRALSNVYFQEAERLAKVNKAVGLAAVGTVALGTV
jgi:hypothetical protein